MDFLSLDVEEWKKNVCCLSIQSYVVYSLTLINTFSAKVQHFGAFAEKPVSSVFRSILAVSTQSGTIKTGDTLISVR